MLRSGRTASDGEITLDSVSRVWSTRVEAMALAQRRIEQSHALRDGDADGSGGTPPASLPVLRAGMIGARSSDMIQKFLEEQL